MRIATLDLRSIRHWRSWKAESFVCDGIPAYTVNFPCGRVPGCILGPIGKKAAVKAFSMACADGWRPDIIHAHFTDMAYFFADVAAENDIKYVVTEHSSAMCGSKIAESLKNQAKYAYSKADALLTVSTMLAEKMKEHTGYDAAILPNIVDTDTFCLHDRRKNNDGSFRFLSASALNYGKGMDILLSAFSLVKTTNAELFIMGGGAEMEPLKRKAEELGISERVQFSGQYTRQQFSSAASEADCFVMASRLETFGVVYIEAMAAGLPVIATRCGGPQDFVTESVGMLVPTEDAQSLAEAMKNMIDKCGEYNRNDISAYAKANFSPERIAAELTEVYKNLLPKVEN